VRLVLHIGDAKCCGAVVGKNSAKREPNPISKISEKSTDGVNEMRYFTLRMTYEMMTTKSLSLTLYCSFSQKEKQGMGGGGGGNEINKIQADVSRHRFLTTPAVIFQ
jgi:hypothetical protein